MQMATHLELVCQRQRHSGEVINDFHDRFVVFFAGVLLSRSHHSDSKHCGILIMNNITAFEAWDCTDLEWINTAHDAASGASAWIQKQHKLNAYHLAGGESNVTFSTTSICHAATFSSGSSLQSRYPIIIENWTSSWWIQADTATCLRGGVASGKNGTHWKNDKSRSPSMMRTGQTLRNGLVPALRLSSAAFLSANTLSRTSDVSH
jgi:hypothetical protein